MKIPATGAAPIDQNCPCKTVCRGEGCPGRGKNCGLHHYIGRRGGGRGVHFGWDRHDVLDDTGGQESSCENELTMTLIRSHAFSMHGYENIKN